MYVSSLAINFKALRSPLLDTQPQPRHSPPLQASSSPGLSDVSLILIDTALESSFHSTHGPLPLLLFNFPNPEPRPNSTTKLTMSATVASATPVSYSQVATASKPKPTGSQNIIRTNAGAVAPVFF
ncbi:hypothetical protein C8Q80DRAFT_1117239 [Daedaleopsis nitida]|nr:hypothetical protein C8Q80DRAFT_1117239 [Daedaleopsis nitida]